MVRVRVRVGPGSVIRWPARGWICCSKLALPTQPKPTIEHPVSRQTLRGGVQGCTPPRPPAGYQGTRWQSVSASSSNCQCLLFRSGRALGWTKTLAWGLTNRVLVLPQVNQVQGCCIPTIGQRSQFAGRRRSSRPFLVGGRQCVQLWDHCW